MELNTIYNEDNLITLSNMPDGFLDLVVTSPPYDGLRDYKGFPSYSLKRHRDTARLLYRKLKDGGVVVWVVGDSTVDGSETGTSFKQALLFKKVGFRLHDTMIYEKLGSFGEYGFRYYPVFEYMLILSKGKPKTFNPIMDRKANPLNLRRERKFRRRQKDGSLKERRVFTVKEIGKRNNVWRIDSGFCKSSTDTFAFDHPAIFPEKLAKDHILSWSNEGDLVYDPFMGSGTVAKACIELKRNWIGSEISKEYIEIINKRIIHSQPGLL